MNYVIVVSSKSKISLANFFKFFNKKFSSTLSYSVILSQSQKKTNSKKVAVLKSPHVNKTAQVHFSFSTFSKRILIFSHKPNKFFLFMKRIQSNLFPDVKIKIKSYVKSKSVNQLSSKFLNPNNSILDLSNLNQSDQLFAAKIDSKLVPPIRNLIISGQVPFQERTNSYRLLPNKVISYLRLFDCYGESTFLSFKKNVFR